MKLFDAATGLARLLTLVLIFAATALLSDGLAMNASASNRHSGAPESRIVAAQAHDIALAGCVAAGPASVHLSDTTGAVMLVMCESTNLSDHDDAVVITSADDLLATSLPEGCVATASLVIPGRTDFVLLAGEQKQLYYRVKFECHAPAVGDGYTDLVEANIGTRANKPCGGDGWPANPVHSGLSFNKLDLEDLSSFVAPVRRLNTSPRDANFDVRWDLVPGATVGDTINVQDMAALSPSSSSPTMYPPMLGGESAFGKTCPWPP